MNALRGIASVVAGCLLMSMSGAAAFASLPPGSSPHDDITEDAAMAAGFPPEAVKALQEAVRAPDMDEMEWDPESGEPTRIDAKSDYDPSHHCDRVAPATDSGTLDATGAYVRERRDHARAALAAGNATEAMHALGDALHALQDCFSHSNAVDLDQDARASMVDALLSGAPSPVGIRITAFDPGADKPGLPSDPYPHDRFAKDRAEGNDESQLVVDGNRTKFGVAKDLAISASTRLLHEFLVDLTPTEMAQLGEVRATEPGDKWPIPGPQTMLVLLVVALAVAVLYARR